MLMGAILAYSAGKAVLSAAFGGAKKAIASGASNLFGRMMGGVGSTATKAASTGVGSGGSLRLRCYKVQVVKQTV